MFNTASASKIIAAKVTTVAMVTVFHTKYCVYRYATLSTMTSAEDTFSDTNSLSVIQTPCKN